MKILISRISTDRLIITNLLIALGAAIFIGCLMGMRSGSLARGIITGIVAGYGTYVLLAL